MAIAETISLSSFPLLQPKLSTLRLKLNKKTKQKLPENGKNQIDLECPRFW